MARVKFQLSCVNDLLRFLLNLYAGKVKTSIPIHRMFPELAHTHILTFYVYFFHLHIIKQTMCLMWFDVFICSCETKVKD